MTLVFDNRPAGAATIPASAAVTSPGTDAPADPVALLRGVDLVKTYAIGRDGVFRKANRFRAVDGVSIDVRAGETLGIVGESGCGKTTLGRMLAGLSRPNAGEVRFDGQPVGQWTEAEWRAARRRIQMIFQDAPGSLDPRVPVEDQIAEPLDIHGIGDLAARRSRAHEMLDAVKLGRHLWRSVPSELSGGQQQRVVIARALSLEPDLVICDEPVSALDVSIQAQVITLLKNLRDAMGLAMVFISHDLAVIRQIADRVAVMYLGRVVEEGPVEEVLANPRHPYARALISAVPVPDPRADRRRVLLAGEPPSPHRPPDGCHFHPRCPRSLDDCRTEPPAMTALEARRFACHNPATEDHA